MLVTTANPGINVDRSNASRTIRSPPDSDPSCRSATVPGVICPGGRGIVHRRNKRDFPFPHCAPSVRLDHQPQAR